jgi:hypothetical protein
MNTPPVGGRLALHVKEWKKSSNHQWIIQTVKGYKIPFISTPPYMSPRSMTQEQVYIIEKEIANLLQKAVELTLSETGFHCRIFAVPKKDGGWRPVLDLSNLNHCVINTHFKMEYLINLKDLISQGDSLIKVDLKDACLTVPVHKESQPYLKFKWKNNTYQCVTLPFGLAPASYVFTKLLRPVVTHFRILGGWKMMIYIDDILIFASNREATSKLATEVLEVLQTLGFVINWEKSSLSPLQILEYLGMIVDTILMELRLPWDKVANLQKEYSSIIKKTTITLRTLMRLGKCQPPFRQYWKPHCITDSFKLMPTNFATKEFTWTRILPSLIYI